MGRATQEQPSLFRSALMLTPVLRWVAVLVAAFLLSLAVFPMPAAADGPLDQQARDIAKELQCPICQNLSVADSPSELATQMRGIIREQLEAGKTRQEIEDYFVARYGESVLRNPPKEGFNLLVWWIPPIVLAVAAGLVVRMLSGRATRSASAVDEGPALTEQERERYGRLLEQELHGKAEGRP